MVIARDPSPFRPWSATTWSCPSCCAGWKSHAMDADLGRWLLVNPSFGWPSSPSAARLLYYRQAGEAYALVAIGLISFAAVAQFAPPVIGALYWRGGTRGGGPGRAIAGFLVRGSMEHLCCCLLRPSRGGLPYRIHRLLAPSASFAQAPSPLWAHGLERDYPLGPSGA